MKDRDGKIIKSAVENLCAEKEFYNFSLDLPDEDTGDAFDYDKCVFDKIDGVIAPILEKIINQNSADSLTKDEIKNLAKYVVYQFYRSPAIKDIARNLYIDEKNIRQAQGLILLDSKFFDDLSNALIKLNLKIINATEDSAFIISDSPVLWSPTAEGIYFPISPKHCLCYHKKNSALLDCILINELEFLVSVKFNIANNKAILKSIWNREYDKHVASFCSVNTGSYWSCILITKKSSICINHFKEKIHKDFARLIDYSF
jgi:Protein of unknown function (DUF4238)